MNNKEKIEQLESDIEYLFKEYKIEKKKVAYMESGLGMRELEIDNKKKELNFLRVAVEKKDVTQ